MKNELKLTISGENSFFYVNNFRVNLNKLMKIELIPTPLGNYKRGNFINLYPYGETELFVVYYYPIGSKRQRKEPFRNWMDNVTKFMDIFFFTTTIGLYMLRKFLKIRGDIFISSYFDVNIVIFGSGILHIRHKIERIFFGILLIGSFFLSSVWINGFLFENCLISEQKIDSFADLKRINAPIFIDQLLESHEGFILEMLR